MQKTHISLGFASSPRHQILGGRALTRKIPEKAKSIHAFFITRFYHVWRCCVVLNMNLWFLLVLFLWLSCFLVIKVITNSVQIVASSKSGNPEKVNYWFAPNAYFDTGIFLGFFHFNIDTRVLRYYKTLTIFGESPYWKFLLALLQHFKNMRILNDRHLNKLSLSFYLRYLPTKVFTTRHFPLLQTS